MLSRAMAKETILEAMILTALRILPDCDVELRRLLALQHADGVAWNPSKPTRSPAKDLDQLMQEDLKRPEPPIR